jgi:hypothetical protein
VDNECMHGPAGRGSSSEMQLHVGFQVQQNPYGTRALQPRQKVEIRRPGWGHRLAVYRLARSRFKTK